MSNPSATTRSWWLTAGILGAAFVWSASCEPEPTATLTEVGQATLEGFATELMLPALDRATTDTAALAAAIDAWSASGSATDREAAQAAWIDAMAAWQHLELLQVGPAASSLTDVLGEDRRDAIYSFPTTNGCAVDQALVAEDYTASDFATASLVTARGFDALERLLYGEAATACAEGTTLVNEGSWDALSEEELTARRGAYGAAVAEAIEAELATLTASWEGTLGSDLASAYGSGPEALDALFRAIFYLEKITKDRKIGLPVGAIDCSTDTCPDDVELLASGASHRWVQVNLAAAELLFGIEDSSRFAALLVEAGEQTVLDDITTAFATADTAFEALDAPLDTMLVDEVDTVQAAYDGVKLVTDLLKGEVAVVLSLEVPAEAAGDND